MLSSSLRSRKINVSADTVLPPRFCVFDRFEFSEKTISRLDILYANALVATIDIAIALTPVRVFFKIFILYSPNAFR